MDQRIQQEYRDSDGYWIYLKPGFIVRGDWTHGITESTKREARAKLGMVVPCQCEECKRLAK